MNYVILKRMYIKKYTFHFKETFADVDSLKNWISFSPNTSLEKRMRIFLNWYLDFYDLRIKNL